MYVDVPLQIDLLITDTRSEHNLAVCLHLNVYLYFSFIKSHKTEVYNEVYFTYR